ncbi:hypothetical protein OG802_34625 [Streptomyces sp. NBC_00704]|uniref:hypothetical protein n=1 Tax=Streptomyces sp. NBC_00704 TaxID=2975809 RepID=UPI002E316E60|nr:hypothetical protein [Streptomyces sp. NBC_00704]
MQRPQDEVPLPVLRSARFDAVLRRITESAVTLVDAQDEAVLRTLAAAAGVAIDNARLYEDSRRRERWLAASSELTRSLLSGTDPEQVLHRVAATVRMLSGADLVTPAVPFDGGELVIEAADGEGAEQVHGHGRQPPPGNPQAAP